MLGETDEWAHGRRYDLYLDSAWRNDRFIRSLWETAQSMSEYTGDTALILATDHGRGNTGRELDEPRRKSARVGSNLDGRDGTGHRAARCASKA